MVEIGLTVDLPKQAKPGEEISIRLGVNKPSDVFLVVSDPRLISESPTKKLGKKIFQAVKENLTTLEADSISRTENIRRLSITGPVDSILAVEEVEDVSFLFSEQRSLNRQSESLSVAQVKSIDSLSLRAKVGGVTTLEEIDLDLTPSRLEFPAVVYCELLKLEKKEVVKVKLGDQIGQWKVSVYAFAGTDFVSQIKEIVATQEAYVEINVPSVLAEGSEIEGVVRYKSPELAALKIYGSAVSPSVEKCVQGKGEEKFLLQHCGEVAVTLTDLDGNILDETSKIISPPAQQTITVARVQVLDRDQEIIAPEGGRVVIYSEWSVVQGEVTDSVVRYVTDRDCAQQTATKLYALNLRRQSILAGGNGRGGELGQIKENMNMGINRLRSSFFRDGLISLWPKGRPEVGVTHRVVRDLLPLRKDFNSVKEMVQATISPLLKAKIQDNRLIVLDPAFRKGVLETIEDAVDLFEAEDSQPREEALEFIKNSAILSKDGSTAYWTNTKSWGGALEATCLAAKVLYQTKDPLFNPAFNYLAGKLVNGMLHSTADSQALLELLSIMKTEGNGRRGIIDGEEIEVSSLIIAQTVKAIDPLIVKIEEKKTINYFDLTPNFNFKVEISKTNLKLGEKATIKIIALEESLCPEAWIYLPSNLTFLKGGANVQVRYMPLKTKEIEEEVVAVRIGSDIGYVTLHDMYDAEKIGIASGVPIMVS